MTSLIVSTVPGIEGLVPERAPIWYSLLCLRPAFLASWKIDVIETLSGSQFVFGDSSYRSEKVQDIKTPYYRYISSW